MIIEKNFNLIAGNTFGVEAIADYFVILKDKADLIEFAQSEFARSEKLFILGGGSNVLFTRDYDGVVVSPEFLGFDVVEENDENVVVRFGAGEAWSDCVERCVVSGFYGLENLAMIPGKAGAAPVQNIGAYGIEQKDRFHKVYSFDFTTGKEIVLDKEACEFGYRFSAFKRESSKTMINYAVEYKLSKLPKVEADYMDLREELKNRGAVAAGPRDVFEAICAVRGRKLPDYKFAGNAGSFFKNPLADFDVFLDLAERWPGIPRFPGVGDKVKLSAAWLIESAGLKGYQSGKAAVSDKHALILVNTGGAKGAEIDRLANEVAEIVFAKFGVRLEREVITL